MDLVLGPAARCSTSLSISQPLSPEADHSVVRGTESLFGPFGGFGFVRLARIAMNAEANRFHSLLWVQSQFGVCPGS